MITEEEYQQIKRFESIIDTFIKSKYCSRATVPMLNDMKTIYEKYVKRKVNIFCGSCVMTMFKSLKKLLLEYEANRRNSRVVEQESNDNNNIGVGSDIPVQSSTRATGRGKKSSKKKQKQVDSSHKGNTSGGNEQ